ncbi:MAG TPA: acyl-CoA dehydrogenase family protein [Solirubrobacteraceae bacterium]|nr:acyl-CoA dehydrogenase family protein [Solirubrobacteraceae bacterium]
MSGSPLALQGQAGGEELLTRARRVAGTAAPLAAEIERERSLPPALVRELLEAGMMSLCLPRTLGGVEAEPREFVLALQELARGDGATGWCAMIASTSGLLGAYLPEDEARAIYGGGATISAGVFAPRGRAERCEDGYRVSGRWPFVSGIGHSEWLMGGCIVHADGAPELHSGGRPDVRLMLMPAASVEVIDTWSVSGLRGTGSHDMAVEDELVPEARGVSLLSEPPRAAGALYAFPLFGLLALGIASVALGIARGAIEDLVELAAGKTPLGSARSLAQRGTVQAEVARSEAALRAACALMLDEVARAWEQALAGDAISTERRMGLRLAATHATRSAADVARAMYELGGGSSIYEQSPLQRRFRDAHVATQHMMVAPSTWELTGRLLLGVETDATQL